MWHDMIKITLVSGLMIAIVAVPAVAQQSTDVVIMRRSVAPPRIGQIPVHQTGTWSEGIPVSAPGCSATTPTLAPVTCIAADGTILPDNKCSAPKPDGRGQTTDYSACSYKWITGIYSAPTPDCSDNAYKTRIVSCQRQDPALTPVNNSFCDPLSPDAKTQDGPVGYYDGCTYTPTYSTTYGACVNGTQSAPITSCRRSDDTAVAVTLCGLNAQSISRTCTPSICNSLQPGHTVAQYTNFRKVGVTTGYATLALAKQACEQEANIQVCYINHYIGPPHEAEASRGTPYDAYVATTGVVGGLTSTPGRNIYSSSCQAR